jgi:hypothetical protein
LTVQPLLLLVVAGVTLWIAFAILAVALCRLAARGDQTSIEAPVSTPALFAAYAADDHAAEGCVGRSHVRPRAERSVHAGHRRPA